MKDVKFVEKYALVIKDLFESDYHRILDDEDLMERLFGEVSRLRENLYEVECEVERLRDELDELKFSY